MIQDVKELFIEKEALLKGHFKLSSGLHSNAYLQSAKVLQYPNIATELCKRLADEFNDTSIDLVLAPALGGIYVTHETARALGVRSIFVERVNGEFQLRRGFEIKPGEKILVVEDVITTGKSTKEVVDLLSKTEGELAGVGCLVDRSGKDLDFGVPFKSLLKIDIDSYEESECPDCLKNIPVVKPGSREVFK